VLIDHTHRKWLITTLVVLGLATAVYLPYAARSPQGPSGGSALGLTYGIVGSVLMLFAGLLSARKKVPVWRVGRAQTWMRGHLWLGLLSFPLILFHAGFHLGGPLTTTLIVLFILVVASGVLGAILQHYLPSAMTVQVPMETIFEQIDHVRAQLRSEADQLVAAVCGPRGIEGAQRPDNPGPIAAAATRVEVAEEVTARLQDFYLRQMRPFLDDPAQRNHPLSDAAQTPGIFQQLRVLLPPALGETVQDLENICEEERQLTQQVRLHHWLHGWLLLHIPLSFALLLLGAVHAVMALRY
jgi:hypothetical protein